MKRKFDEINNKNKLNGKAAPTLVQKDKNVTKPITSSSSSRKNQQQQHVTSSTLPVLAHRDHVLQAVERHQTTIVISETGSGKSTQIPQFLVDHPTLLKGKAVVCTQPRRVAAVTIAEQVSKERGCKLGSEVGFSIRFDDKTQRNTRIKYATDGVLLREIMSDPDLTAYGAIILDEAHERSMQTDILMGLLQPLQRRRPELKILIMSATITTDLFQRFFQDVSVVHIPGRQYPVEMRYLTSPENDYLDAALLTVLQLHEEGSEGVDKSANMLGGILVFLPGQEDIAGLHQLLTEQLPTIRRASSTAAVDAEDYEILPLYAAMPAEEQLKAFLPSKPGKRKIVLATNIAETSVTIAGIRTVIDTGFVKVRSLQSITGVESLRTVPVSKAQATQRTGRAGREGPGFCYRLYPETAYESLEVMAVPEIARSNISQLLLQLKAMGVDRLQSFPFLSPPSPQGMRQALQSLLLLGALDQEQKLTPLGRQMAGLPLTPPYARLLLEAVKEHCAADALTAVSLLSVENLFLQPSGEEEKRKASQAHRALSQRDGDIPTLLHIYHTWQHISQRSRAWSQRNYISQRALQQAEAVRGQLTGLLTRFVGEEAVQEKRWPQEKQPLLRALLAGLAMNIAVRNGGATGAEATVSSAAMTVSGSGASATATIHSKGKFSFSDNVNIGNNGRNGKWQQSQSSQQQFQQKAPYTTLYGGEGVHIHPSSVLFALTHTRTQPQYLLYADLLVTTKQYMRNVTVMEGEWVHEVVARIGSEVGGMTR